MNKARILIVEDDHSLMIVMTHYLKKAGYEAIPFEDGKKALSRIPALLFDIALLDVNLGEVSGFEILDAVKEHFPLCEVLMLTAYSRIEDATRAIKSGAFDYLAKPVSEENLLHRIQNALSKRTLALENTKLKNKLRLNEKPRPLIGNSSAMYKLKKEIQTVAKDDISVLIRGESGTGKELAAREIHRQSLRADGPFIAVNCAAIPEQLMESEFFGHIKGAFTGANADRTGKMAAANGGTLFLDEIAELPLSLQAKLLRALQEREITPVGSDTAQHIDIRVISASNLNLQDQVRQKKFREDLFYRIAVYPLVIPPLRERIEDLDDLIPHFAPHLHFLPDAMKLMRSYSWPGNVRELENVLDFIRVNTQDGLVTSSVLPPLMLQSPTTPHISPDTTVTHASESVKDTSLPTLEEAEKNLILQALQFHSYNQSHAAKALGISRSKLIYKMNKYRIKIEKRAF